MNKTQPKYMIIFNELREQIESGTIESGTYLQSEKELMKTYDVSRDTIRKSLNMLLELGLIQKITGKGSLVLDTAKIAFPLNGIYSFKELAETMPGKVETLSVKIEKLPMTPALEQMVGFAAEELLLVKRVRKINGERVILDSDYFDASIVPEITKEVAEDSIYAFLEKKQKLTIGFTRKEITVVPLEEKERRLLDMEGYDLIVCVESQTYLTDGTPFQYTLSKHRPDKFRFVDFARRL